MHVGETIVHHISEEDDCVWTFALHDAPGLAQIHVDEDPGRGPKERTALRVRPLVEDLWIGDEEDVSRRRRRRRLSISLKSTKSQVKVNLAWGRRGEKTLLLELAMDTAHPQRQRYRFRARGRWQSRRLLLPSANTLEGA